MRAETAICLALDDKLKIYHRKLTTDTLFDLDTALVSARQDTRNTWLQRPRRESASTKEIDTLYNMGIARLDKLGDARLVNRMFPEPVVPRLRNQFMLIRAVCQSSPSCPMSTVPIEDR